MSLERPIEPARGVIIPAAGRGTRFSSDLPKQYHLLAGTPILVHSVRTALGVASVRTVVIAVHKDDVEVVADLISASGLHDVRIHLVVGADERQRSVERALDHPSLSSVDTILVHDAVRPLASHELWERVAEMAERCGAAIPGLPVADTLKHVSSDGIVMDTPDRSAFMRVQTPQGFRADVVRRAYAVARERGTTATDCSSVVEQLGSHVSIVPGEETNFKITTPYDLRVATFLLANSDR